jgi:hypothetical protein
MSFRIPVMDMKLEFQKVYWIGKGIVNKVNLGKTRTE